MNKLFNFIFFGCSFFSSLLCATTVGVSEMPKFKPISFPENDAVFLPTSQGESVGSNGSPNSVPTDEFQIPCATVNFPVNQSVVQTSELFFVDNDRHITLYQNLQSDLNLINIDSLHMDFSLIYQKLLKSSTRFNCDFGYNEISFFNSKDLLLENCGDGYSAESWYRIGEKTHMLSVTFNQIETTEDGQFHAYGSSPLFRNSIWALRYIYNQPLKVGNTFRIYSGNANKNLWEYEITGIDNENVFYKINVTAGSESGQGRGIWKRENGLLGQLDLNIRSDTTFWNFRFSTAPQ